MPDLNPDLQFLFDIGNLFFLINSKGSYDSNGILSVTINYPKNPTSFLSFLITEMLPFFNSSPTCYKINAVQV